MGLPGLPHTATTMKIVEDSGARGQLCPRKATNSNKEGYSTYSRIAPYIYKCIYTKNIYNIYIYIQIYVNIYIMYT